MNNSERPLSLDAVIADYMHSKDPRKRLIHQLRASACRTISTKLEIADLGPVPNPDTQVDEETLYSLFPRVHASFEAIGQIGLDIVAHPDTNSAFEQFLSEHAALIPDDPRFTDSQELLTTIRRATFAVIQRENISEDLVPPYLVVIWRKLSEANKKIPLMRELANSAIASVAILRRFAAGNELDMNAQLDATVISRNPLRFNPDNYQLHPSGRVSVLHSTTKDERALRETYGSTTILTLGCPAFADLIPMIVKKSVLP